MKELCNLTYTNLEHNETDYSQSFQYENCTNSTGFDLDAYFNNISFIVYCVIFSAALPGLCFALHRLCSLARRGEDAPVYVINMLVADLIQISVHLIRSTLWVYGFHDGIAYTLWVVYLYGLQVNVFFMVCISAERYLMIAYAVWYRSVQNARTFAVISVILWVSSAALIVIAYFLEVIFWLMPVVFLLPYPLVMFFFVATWRALSRTSVPRNEQMRIMRTLALVLCIYTVLFVPYVVVFIYSDVEDVEYVNTTSSLMYLSYSSEILTAFNPLFDLLLYVFMRRDAIRILTACLCFCKGREGDAVTTNETDSPI